MNITTHGGTTDASDKLPDVVTIGSKDGLGGGFLPWNHPLRIEAEELVKRWNFYAQTHLPSDSNRELASMIVNFVQAHQPPNVVREPSRTHDAQQPKT